MFKLWEKIYFVGVSALSLLWVVVMIAVFLDLYSYMRVW